MSLTVGDHLREWRQRRGLSQLGLAVEAGVSSRHLSFVETGRSSASREMLLHLAERLEMPLRARNALLGAAGFTPAYGERPVDDAEMALVRTVLEAYAPYPALAVDRRWNVVAMNGAVAPLLGGVAPELLEIPINALRLSLHPRGLAPRTENGAEWRAHLLSRLKAQALATGDPVLRDLHRELVALEPSRVREPFRMETTRVAVPLRLWVDGRLLAFVSTTTVFGTPLDVTLSELAIEAFLPTDDETRAALRALAKGNPPVASRVR